MYISIIVLIENLSSRLSISTQVNPLCPHHLFHLKKLSHPSIIDLYHIHLRLPCKKIWREDTSNSNDRSIDKYKEESKSAETKRKSIPIKKACILNTKT